MYAILMFAILVPVQGKEISFKQLEKIAVEAYKDRLIQITPPEYSQGKAIAAAKGYIWADDPVKDHKYQPLLIELIRLEMWGHNRPSFVTEREHDKALDSCRRLIHEYYRALDKRNNNQFITAMIVEAEYEKELLALATKKGIKLTFQTKAFGFTVDIETIPPDAKVFMISDLKWRLLVEEGKNPKEVIKTTVMTQTKRLQLIGYYYYYLEWPNRHPVGPHRTSVITEGKMILK